MKVLSEGGTIGVVAPAAPVRNRSDLIRAEAFWTERGYKVKLSDRLFEKAGYFAGDAVLRADALSAMFADPDVDAVSSLWGGSGSTLMIPRIDWGVVRKNPKPFVGRSDITSLHIAFARYAPMTTFYGPGYAQVAPAQPSAFTQEHLLAALTKTEPLGRLPTHPDDGFIQTLSAGTASGVLAGGCLWPLCKTIGTDWQPNFRDKILFIEEVDEPPWSIDMHLTHLHQGGLLDGVAGIALGRFVNCEWSPSRAEMPSEFALEEVLERHFACLKVPVIYRVPCGHELDTLTLPLGEEATIEHGRLSITSSPFSAPAGPHP